MGVLYCGGDILGVCVVVDCFFIGCSVDIDSYLVSVDGWCLRGDWVGIVLFGGVGSVWFCGFVVL